MAQRVFDSFSMSPDYWYFTVSQFLRSMFSSVTGYDLIVSIRYWSDD